MGTSVNQSSPPTRNWQAAQATYQNDMFPVDRVLQEVWRAATNQPEGNLADQLAQPIISRLRDIAVAGGTAAEVSAAVNREVSQSKQPSLAIEIARRAAIQCTGAQDRAQAYNERVFAEASNYLLSRDLPGYVGLGNRNRNVAESYEFKQSVMGATTQVVREVQHGATRVAENWPEFAVRVIDHLRRRVG